MQWGPLVMHSHRIESAKKLTHYHRRSSCLQEKEGASLPGSRSLSSGISLARRRQRTFCTKLSPICGESVFSSQRRTSARYLATVLGLGRAGWLDNDNASSSALTCATSTSCSAYTRFKPCTSCIANGLEGQGETPHVLKDGVGY